MEGNFKNSVCPPNNTYKKYIKLLCFSAPFGRFAVQSQSHHFTWHNIILSSNYLNANKYSWATNQREDKDFLLFWSYFVKQNEVLNSMLGHLK